MYKDDLPEQFEEMDIYGPKFGHFEMSGSDPFKTIASVHRHGGGSHEMVFGEPEPRRKDEYPSPTFFLFGSLVSCQMHVLCACLQKARVEEFMIKADGYCVRGLGDVDDELPDGVRKRIEHIDIDLTLEVPEEYAGRAQRCLDVYDTGCIVGQSLRAGIDYTPTTELVVE